MYSVPAGEGEVLITNRHLSPSSHSIRVHYLLSTFAWDLPIHLSFLSNQCHALDDPFARGIHLSSLCSTVIHLLDLRAAEQNLRARILSDVVLSASVLLPVQQEASSSAVRSDTSTVATANVTGNDQDDQQSRRHVH